MRRSNFQAIKYIERFNQQRNSQLAESPVITTNGIVKLLRECQLPSGSVFFLEFVSSVLLSRIAKGIYIWNTPNKPVHYQVLQDIYDRYLKLSNKYRKTYREKKKNPEAINKAIQLLKENNYIILLQEGDMYKKL